MGDANVAGAGDDRHYYGNDPWQLLIEVNGSTVKAIYRCHPFYVDALAVRESNPLPRGESLRRRQSTD